MTIHEKIRIWLFILIICTVLFSQNGYIQSHYKLFGAEMNDDSFEKWSNLWMTNAGEEIFNFDDLNKGITPEKKRVARHVFNLLAPICADYLCIVTCKPSASGVVPEVREAMCINRLLGENSLTNLPNDVSQHIQELLKETFYLGVFTHLYLMKFPTREQSENVNFLLLNRKWQIEAITADLEMGYYGDRQNPILMNLWEFHYETKVVHTLKEYFNPSIFKRWWVMGKFKSYFRNLYVSGALLVGRSRYAADNSRQAPSVMINIL
jgi:hypothetical protein